MKNIFLILLFAGFNLRSAAQGTLKVTTGTSIKTKSNAFIVLKNMSLVNNGSYQQDSGNGTTRITGNINTTTSGTGTTTLDQLEVAVNTGVTHTLTSMVNIKNVLTLTSGQLASDSFLVLKSDSTYTARVAEVTSTASPVVSGNVITERFIRGRRKYRLIASPVTTSTSSVLSAGQESMSIWGNWQNGGINTTPNVGELITGGSTADGFDAGTTNASLYTYDDVNRAFVGYTSANGKNTMYTPLKAGEAFLMFVYGDRLNSVFATNPHNTVLNASGTLVTGDQAYNTSSAIPLTGVTGRFTLLGNPFASPIDWSSIPKTDLANTYWGWDPNLSSTGGYITVTTLGAVTVQAPYSGSTGLNQYIQSGQGFFVKTTGSSPVLTIREQDKVSNYNGNAYRGSLTGGNIPLIAINLEYVSSGATVLADGVLAVFDPSFPDAAGAEDATKMPNSGESLAILNDTTSLSIDARQMPQDHDTLFLNVSRLTKPQYNLQIFAEQMDTGSIHAYLQDSYLNTLQLLSLTDTNNIVINVNAGIPASFDINRFRIIFQSSLIVLPVKFISIKAMQQNKDIKVEWLVAEASGAQKYEVERSADGVSFFKVGEVRARGTYGDESYSWLDVDPLAGNAQHPADNYYRVLAIQEDGNSMISKTVLVKINTGKAGFNIYPNPVTDHQLNIRANEMAKGKYRLLLHNQQGQQVIERMIVHAGGAFNQVIDLSMLPAGIYYLQISGEKDKYDQTISIQ